MVFASLSYVEEPIKDTTTKLKPALSQVTSRLVSKHSISSLPCHHCCAGQWRSPDLRTGQIPYTQNRSANLLGSDWFQLPPSLLSHWSNASQMSHADLLDGLAAGQEHRPRERDRETGKKAD